MPPHLAFLPPRPPTRLPAFLPARLPDFTGIPLKSLPGPTSRALETTLVPRAPGRPYHEALASRSACKVSFVGRYLERMLPLGFEEGAREDED